MLLYEPYLEKNWCLPNFKQSRWYEFDEDDLELLQAMTEQAAIAIQGNIIVEQVEAARART